MRRLNLNVVPRVRPERISAALLGWVGLTTALYGVILMTQFSSGSTSGEALAALFGVMPRQRALDAACLDTLALLPAALATFHLLGARREYADAAAWTALALGAFRLGRSEWTRLDVTRFSSYVTDPADLLQHLAGLVQVVSLASFLVVAALIHLASRSRSQASTRLPSDATAEPASHGRVIGYASASIGHGAPVVSARATALAVAWVGIVLASHPAYMLLQYHRSSGWAAGLTVLALRFAWVALVTATLTISVSVAYAIWTNPATWRAMRVMLFATLCVLAIAITYCLVSAFVVHGQLPSNPARRDSQRIQLAFAIASTIPVGFLFATALALRPTPLLDPPPVPRR